MPPLKALLQREMTRKQFLVTLGMGIITVLGFSSVLKLLTGKDHSLQQAGAITPTEYGGKNAHKI